MCIWDIGDRILFSSSALISSLYPSVPGEGGLGLPSAEAVGS